MTENSERKPRAKNAEYQAFFEAEEQKIQAEEQAEEERERAANPQAYAAKEKREREAKKTYKECRRREIKEEKARLAAKLAEEQFVHDGAVELIEEGYRVMARKTTDPAAVKEMRDWLVTIWEENNPERSKRKQTKRTRTKQRVVRRLGS